MKFGWIGSSDEQFIERIRKGYHWTRNWKWALVALYGALMLGLLAMGVYSKVFRVPTAGLPITPATTVEYQIGYLLGGVHGFLMAFLMFGIVAHLPVLFFELRTWRLLLTYHDRLQQTGLLPTESVETMDVDPHPPRS